MAYKFNPFTANFDRVNPASGISTFLGLTDTPGSYVGSALYTVRVNAGGTALEFTNAGVGTFIGLSDTPGSYTAAGAIYNVNGAVDAVNESGVILTEGANTFNITKGTAILDIAAGASINFDNDFVVDLDITGLIDDDTMGTASDTTLATSESIKAYVDAQVTAADLDFSGDSGTGSVDLDSQTFTLTGTANQVVTSAAGQDIKMALANALSIVTSLDVGSTIAMVGTIDDDTMATATDTTWATSESIKAYVDAQITASDLDFSTNVGGGSVALGTQTLSVVGIANETITQGALQTISVGLANAVNITTSLNIGATLAMTGMIDDDTFATASASLLASSESIKAYVDAQVTAADLDFAGDSGTGSVDLDSQTFTIAGTASEIETTAAGQTITIGLPSAVSITTSLNIGSTIAIVGTLDDDTFATATDTTTATSESIKAYVDAQVSASDLDFGGDSGTGSVDLDSQTFTIAGTANEIETSAAAQTLTVGLPSAVAITTSLNVGGTIAMVGTIDDDTMATATDTTWATSESIKAYVDAQVTAADLDFAGDSGTGAVDLDSQTFTIAGTAGEIETSAALQTITIGLPSAVTIATSLNVGSTIAMVGTIDDDTMATATNTTWATSESIKAYVDAQAHQSNTLDEAYDEGGAGAGRTITVDTGAVQLDVAATEVGLYVDASTIDQTQAGATVNFKIDSAVDSKIGVLNDYTVTAGTAFNFANKVSLTSAGMDTNGHFNAANIVAVNPSASDVAGTTLAGHFTVLESSPAGSAAEFTGMGTIASDGIPVAVNYAGTGDVLGLFAQLHHVGGTGDVTGLQLFVQNSTVAAGSITGASIFIQPDIAGFTSAIGLQVGNSGSQTADTGIQEFGSFNVGLSLTGTHTIGIDVSGTNTTAIRTANGDVDFNFNSGQSIFIDGSTAARGFGDVLVDIDMTTGAGNEQAMNIFTKMGGDYNNVKGIENQFDATGIGMTSGNLSIGYDGIMSGDGTDTNHTYQLMTLTANANSGAGTFVGLTLTGTDFDWAINTGSGAIQHLFNDGQTYVQDFQGQTLGATMSKVIVQSTGNLTTGFNSEFAINADVSDNIAIKGLINNKFSGASLGNTLTAFDADITVNSGDVDMNYIAYRGNNVTPQGTNNVYGLWLGTGYDFDIYVDDNAVFRIKGNLTLETTAGELAIQSSNEINFSDANKATSTYTGTFKLSETQAEWDTFEVNFGEVSLLAAINAAYSASSSFDTLDECYDGPGGSGSGRTIDVDSGSVLMTVSDTDNNRVLDLVQNDVTNNLPALGITNTGTGADIYFNTDGYIFAASGGLKLENATSGDMDLISAGEITFDDVNRGTSTYSTPMKFSDTAGEWDAFEVAFGEVSLINAIQQASTTGGAGASLAVTLGIGATTGGTDITVSAGDQIIFTDSATSPPFNVTERSAAPSAPAANDIYLDDGTNTASTNPGWRRYTGAVWEDISAGGGGGGETLAQTLVLGNTTGGTNIVISSGDGITASGNDIPIQATGGDIALATSNSDGATQNQITFSGGAVDMAAQLNLTETELIVAPTGASAQNHFASYLETRLAANQNLTATDGALGSIQSALIQAGTATLTSMVNFHASANLVGAGTITDSYTILVDNQSDLSGTFTNETFVWLQNSGASGADNTYFLKLDAASNWKSGENLVVNDNGTDKYIPFSTASTGLTRDTADVIIATTTSGDVHIKPLTDLVFSDGNQAASGYSAELRLSGGFAEWNTFETNFGEVSIMNAINQAAASGGSLDDAYDFGGAGGGRTITVDSGSVTFDGTTAAPTTSLINANFGDAGDPCVTTDLHALHFTGVWGNANIYGTGIRADVISGGMTTSNNLISAFYALPVTSASDAADTYLIGYTAELVDNAGSQTTIAYAVGTGGGGTFDYAMASVDTDMTIATFLGGDIIITPADSTTGSTRHRFYVTATATDITSGMDMANFEMTWTPTADRATSVSALNANVAHTSNFDLTDPTGMHGIECSVGQFGSGTATGVTNFLGGATVSSGGTITNAYYNVVSNFIDTACTMTNQVFTYLVDAGGPVAPTNSFLFEHSTSKAASEWTVSTYNYACKFTDDTLYVPLSESDNGITRTSANVVLETNTSGNITFRPAQSVTIDQNNNVTSLIIDTEATNQDTITVAANTKTAGYTISSTDAASLVSGGFLEFTTNSAGYVGNMMILIQEHASVSSGRVAFLRQDGSADGVYMDKNSYGNGIYIDANTSSTLELNALRLYANNSGSGDANAIYSNAGSYEIIFSGPAGDRMFITANNTTRTGGIIDINASMGSSSTKIMHGSMSLLGGYTGNIGIKMDTNGQSGGQTSTTHYNFYSDVSGNGSDSSVTYNGYYAGGNPNGGTNTNLRGFVVGTNMTHAMYAQSGDISFIGYSPTIAASSGSITIQTVGTGDIHLDPVDTATIGDGGTTNYTEFSNTGDILFKGSAGLAFGEIYANEVTDTITIGTSGKANKVQITSFDTNGESNNSTPDHTNDHITITEPGRYLVTVSLNVNSLAGSNAQFGFSLWKNNGATEFGNVASQRDLPAGSGDHAGSISMSGICDFADNDTVELWGWNNDNTQNFEVDNVTLSVVQVGG